MPSLSEIIRQDVENFWQEIRKAQEQLRTSIDREKLTKIANDYYEKYVGPLPTDAQGIVLAHNNEVDAFRHAFAMGYVVLNCGETIAKIGGYGIEIRSHIFFYYNALNQTVPDIISLVFSRDLETLGTQAQILLAEFKNLSSQGKELSQETNMDLWNDYVGLNYVRTTTSEDEFAKSLAKALKNGELITSIKDDNPSYSERIGPNYLPYSFESDSPSEEIFQRFLKTLDTEINKLQGDPWDSNWPNWVTDNTKQGWEYFYDSQGKSNLPNNGKAINFPLPGNGDINLNDYYQLPVDDGWSSIGDFIGNWNWDFGLDSSFPERQNSSIQSQISEAEDIFLDSDPFSSIENNTVSVLADTLTGDAKANVLSGSFGNDVIKGGSGNDCLNGEKDNDLLYGQDGNDTLNGDAGADVLEGGKGADVLIGGDGIDVVSYENSVTKVIVNLTNGKAKGGEAQGDLLKSIEGIIGSTFNDTLIGNSRGNVLAGGAGKDTLFGGGGHDIYSFGRGDGGDYIADSFQYKQAVYKQVKGLHYEWKEESRQDDNGDIIYTKSYAPVVDYDTLYLNTQLDGGSDTLAFGADITPDDIQIQISGKDIIVGLKDANNPNIPFTQLTDKITLKNWFDTNSRIEAFQFADDTVLDTARLILASPGSDTFNGGGGDDTYHFSRGDGLDTVYDDYRYKQPYVYYETAVTFSGADVYTVKITTDGGEIHYPERRITVPVTYYVPHKDTRTVQLDGGSDTLTFGDGITPDDIQIKISGKDLIVGLKDENNPDTPFSNLSDKLTIKNWFEPKNRIETFTFVDGTVLDLAGIASKFGTNEADTITWIETPVSINGGVGNDRITTGKGNDTLIGGVGADTLNGGKGIDTASYAGSTAGVSVNLTTGKGLDGEAQGDRLLNIENLEGSGFNDTLIGNTLANILSGGAGSDLLDGGKGIDTAAYEGSTAGVNVNLVSGVGVGGDAEGDRLSNIENLSGSDWNDTLTGNALANLLSGSKGNDSLSGNAGNDRLLGSEDDDWLNGGQGNDTLDGGTGDDLLNGGTDHDWLYGREGNDTLSGNAGNDRLYGQEGNDNLDGNEGNDFLDGGIGTDTLSGSAENDILYGQEGDDWLKGNEGKDSLYGGADDDLLEGGTDNDWLYGQDGDDTLEGNAGSDRLYGQKGNDSLSGSEGNDLLYAGNGDDVLVGGDGQDTLSGDIGNDSLSGSDGNDSLSGGAGQDLLAGEIGDDRLYGGDGQDTLLGNAGADLLNGGLGKDTASYETSKAGVNANLATGKGQSGDAEGDRFIEVENLAGSAFADTLNGNAGANILIGGIGTDTLAGSGGQDTLIGGAEADLLNGGKDIDTASYEDSKAGVSVNLTSGIGVGGDATGDRLVDIENIVGSELNDTLAGSVQANVLTGGGGNDTLTGGAGNDKLYGDTSNSTLAGGVGDDWLYGEEGNDTLVGGAGADTLVGGIGTDLLIGNSGSNTYLFGLGSGKDVIDNYDTEQSTNLLIFEKGIRTDRLSFRRSNNNLIVGVIGTGDQVTIKNWYAGNTYRLDELRTVDDSVVLYANQVEQMVGG